MVCLLKMCNGWVSCSTKEQGQSSHCKCQSEFTSVTFYFKGTFWVRHFDLYLEIWISLTVFCDDNIFLICQPVFFTFIGPQQSHQLIIASTLTGSTAEQTPVCLPETSTWLHLDSRFQCPGSSLHTRIDCVQSWAVSQHRFHSPHLFPSPHTHFWSEQLSQEHWEVFALLSLL